MKISDRDKKIIMFIILLAIVLLPIFLFIRPKIQSIKDLDTELVTLNERHAYLKELYEKKDWYEAETADLMQKREALINGYAQGIKQENTILYLRDIELEYPIYMSTESFGGYEETVVTSGSVDENGNVVGDLTAVVSNTNVSYYGEYDQIVRFLDYIFADKDKKCIPSISLAYDGESGYFVGNFVLREYAFEGSGRSVDSRKVQGMERGGNETAFYYEHLMVEGEEEAEEEIVVETETDNTEAPVEE